MTSCFVYADVTAYLAARALAHGPLAFSGSCFVTKLSFPERDFKDEMTVLLHLADDEDFKVLCARQGIDPAPYFGNETNALLCNNVSYTKKAKKAFSDSMLGQKLYYDDRRKNNPAVVTLKDFVEYEEDPHIFGMNSKNTVIAVIPYSTYVKTVYGDDIPEDLCQSFGIGILSVLWGIPLAIIFSILMTELLPVSSRIRLNIPLYLMSAAAVFLIIWLTMSVSVRELKNDTIVEVLKEEIS